MGVLLIRGATNPKNHKEIELHKQRLMDSLRSQFKNAERATLKNLERIKAYSAYYKKYDQTYHVLLQLESVALKGKQLPCVSALVDTMFAAELKNQLLTAGHDSDTVELPLTLDAAKGDESYIIIDICYNLLYPLEIPAEALLEITVPRLRALATTLGIEKLRAMSVEEIKSAASALTLPE